MGECGDTSAQEQESWIYVDICVSTLGPPPTPPARGRGPPPLWGGGVGWGGSWSMAGSPLPPLWDVGVVGQKFRKETTDLNNE